ncbi:gamma-glutamyltransferase family protein [Rhodobaculum claviforme]|uniref:Gamma-glutamyltransferase n=1 Tax=Rhodobaculum claviforme TaxID=1549854 RepID=A0A934TNS0_9RHOB|nr:gamma-glutamyltransferase family protein [Rhodobaculum claviforme]MBK5928458.1 gamma-glutamyltransferase [Rhodobaculum claviforme]
MRDFHRPGRSEVLATGGMVATSHPIAAQAGAQILRAGGNAADAAIAMATTLHVCEPHMCGLGGDCFVLVKPAGTETVHALNGSGRAPARASSEALRAAGHTTIPLDDPASVTVPGAVDALCRLAADHGRLGLDQTLAPAIHHADTGVPVAARVAADWVDAGARLKGVARDFYLMQGAAPAERAIFRAPGQAEVLRRIAVRGRAGFYEGEVAEDMVASLRAMGGVHTSEDFAETACSWGEPISATYRGAELLEHPPNGQGATAALILNILSQFDMASMAPDSPERVHILAEATKLGYDARDRFISDPETCDRLDHMLSMDTAAKLAALIDPARALETPVAQATAAVHRDTVLMCAVDRDGMAVTLIHSIFHAFGSGLASDRFGLLFQNRGAGFSLTQGHPNEMAPRRRPMHTIIPAMLREDGRVTLAFGVMGGQYQATGHAHVLGNLRDHGMGLQQALDAPRSFAVDGTLELEHGYDPALMEAITARGHAALWRPEPLGGAQAIGIDHARGVLIGASDPRKDGCAIGL